jgi:hypothetical protein
MNSSLALRSGKVHSSVPNYRSDYINLKLKQFIEQCNIKAWPLDCVELICRMRKTGEYGVQLVKVVRGLPDKLDASAHYNKKTGYYAVFINSSHFSYPFQKSSDRRLNFTLAHEIGHIVLEHLTINYKSGSDDKLQYTDEAEADEFAARLLMPRELLCSLNYYSISQAAAWLNVSNSALICRLNRLNRLDLITSRKVKSCTRCGNIRFSAFAAYCGICGHYLPGESKGIRRIYYPDMVSMDSRKRSLVCINCHTNIANISGEYCPYCGTCIFNLCIDEACSYANPAYARNCEMCGKPTGYQKKFTSPCIVTNITDIHQLI